MTKRICRASVLFVLTGLLAGCEAAKSANPLSPSIAGPIPGVSISSPKLLEPAAGWTIDSTQQPVQLLIENASSNGQRPLSYSFEIASDAGFSSRVYTRDGVPQGDGGRTSLRLPDALAAGQTYYWRARAQDGANTGPYSAAVNFNIEAPVVLLAPALVSPIGGDRIDSTRPTFRFRNAVRSGPAGTVIYALEVSANDSFTSRYGVWTAPEQPGETTISPVLDLPYDKPAYWRVRAQEGYKGVISDWSAVGLFYAAPAPPPPPSGGGGGGGGEPAGDWQQCSSLIGDKPALSSCVHGAVNPGQGAEAAFEVTKRIAWLLRGEGGGLLIKNGGENIVSWKGYSFAAGRICYSDGHIFKVLTDVGGGNGSGWSDNGFVERSLYVPAIDPN